VALVLFTAPADGLEISSAIASWPFPPGHTAPLELRVTGPEGRLDVPPHADPLAHQFISPIGPGRPQALIPVA